MNQETRVKFQFPPISKSWRLKVCFLIYKKVPKLSYLTFSLMIVHLSFLSVLVVSAIVP